MPTADAFEWPQGQPLFEVMWRAVTESLAGNGVVNNGDLEVTATANALEIQVAAGSYFSIATTYTLGAAETHTLSAGDGSNDRWDTVWFDTGTGASGVTEGTPAADPEPPDVTGDQQPLAFVYVAQNASDVVDADILNWRAKFSNEAEDVQYDDGTGVYGVNNVNDALDELQEAAQITAYPLDLNVDTDMDVDGTDLTDGATVVWDASASEVPQAQLGGPAASLSAYPLAPGTDLNVNAYPFAIGDLASPFSLPSITDMDAAGNDLVDGGTTIWDTSAGWVPRGSVDDEKVTTTYSTTPNTTSGEEVAIVDTATIGSASTLTLASADANAGNQILVVDGTGTAASNPITVDTEGSETIDGASSTTIDDNYGSALFTSDGTNWFIAGGTAAGSDPTAIVDGAESGNVPASDQGILVVDSLSPGDTIRIQKAVLTTASVEAIPSGVDLKLVTFDNAGSFTNQSALITGDGATVYDRVTGSPLASYENTGTAAESVGVIVDNTTTTAHEVMADVRGDII
ncbi:baseplate protein [Haloarcula hispanica tailed virus 2]|uniref:Uncharacterized protein n=1 Tax=Haloarcula hispanica tailed virus 2 TaxID=1273751 RepID=R4TKM6_9CAUD|nr:baseplate protein [Haloarcula hispanica tailed virus 2]AGM11227.1 hypothetical protein HHTV2_62 [Haloarcula hispanica tailed virus 2]